MKIKSLILAAGQGTRMKSQKPKVLHEVLGQPLVYYPIEAGKTAGALETCLVIGHGAEKVQAKMGENYQYVLQKEQLGTGHAVMQAIAFIENSDHLIILNGDIPLITGETIKKMVEYHLNKKNAATVLSAKVSNPTGYGRMIRDENGIFSKIVEQKDLSPEQLEVDEINGGMYVFESQALLSALSQLTNTNAQNEYYLTDTIEILLQAGRKVDAYVISGEEEILGVNSREQLAQTTAILQQRILKQHMANGVTIIDPQNTYIESSVRIGQDTIVEPGCMLKGETSIGSRCEIGYHTKLTNMTIKDDVVIDISVLTDSVVEEGAHIGPFAYVRPNSRIGKMTKIGDFVEIKNAVIGEGTKVSHLTYIGDADVGKNVNFGCGTVVVNYDGEKKHRSTIGDHAFIGCNTNLVSPVVVEESAYTAAGSTITERVPKDSLGIARARQENKEGWVKRKKKQ
jgi:bifunctional UDP-N-acetylglucosamine pyrophosphorylase/glucosamine-1-phosphate N-acetyltransferase